MEINNEASALAKKIVGILDSKKAEDIKVLHIGELTILADFFIICTGNSNTQVKALSDAVEEKLSEEKIEPLRVEGLRGGLWVLIDYGSVVVHIMYKEARDFYKLERIWVDAEQIDLLDKQEGKND